MHPLNCAAVAFSILLVGVAQRPAAAAIYEPDVVATIVIDGIDSDGPSADGVVGLDESHVLIDDLADLMNSAAGYLNPTAPNQITMTEHYGDTYPPYYSANDRAEVDQITDQYGGGIPRYAAIIAKFSRQVMERSGARQVNIVGLSMGALIGRWMIEKDYEGLASGQKIARFITVEGVVCGNWPSSLGGPVFEFINDEFELEAIDLEHMSYDWIEDNLNNPRTEMDNPLYANIQVSHWASTDDNMNSQALTISAGESNDGIQLVEDTFFHEVTNQSKYFGQRPTLSHVHATHESVKQHMGIRAGLIADLTSTRRVRVTLVNALVKDMPESGEGEVVFGARILSPHAQTLYGIMAGINQIGAIGHVTDPVEMDEDERVTLNQILFDDFILPDEQSLTVDFGVREIDFEPLVYGIFEDPFGDEYESIPSNNVIVSTLNSGQYVHDNSDWNGMIQVEVIDYPGFLQQTGAERWIDYR